MRSRPLLLAAAGLFVLLALVWWVRPREREGNPASSPAPTPPATRESTPPRPTTGLPPPSLPIAAAPIDGGATEAQDEHEHAPTPTADLELYARRPMSAVPHRVLRGWGASGDAGRPGLVGAYVIVDPEISDAQLTQLCKDIREYHDGAKALRVRILDSEEAASYDTHTDGGALKEQHQVATVSRDPKVDVDEFRVRGKIVEP